MSGASLWTGDHFGPGSGGNGGAREEGGVEDGSRKYVRCIGTRAEAREAPGMLG